MHCLPFHTRDPGYEAEKKPLGDDDEQRFRRVLLTLGMDLNLTKSAMEYSCWCEMLNEKFSDVSEPE